MNKIRLRRLAGPLGLVLVTGLILATACERIAPVRTLPTWVRGVYVPMFKNTSYEPGVEEIVTAQTQEAFLSDGRLDVVRKDQADLFVVGEITDWTSRVTGSTGDQVATRQELAVTAKVQLFEPFDEKPLADLGDVTARAGFNTDARSVDYVPEPDRKQRLLELLAQEVVFKTITGFPVELRGLPPGTLLPKAVSPNDVGQDEVLKQRKGADVQ